MGDDGIQISTKSVHYSHGIQNTGMTKLSEAFDDSLKSSDGEEILTNKQPPINDNLQNNDLYNITDRNQATAGPDNPIKKELDRPELLKESTTSAERKKDNGQGEMNGEKEGLLYMSEKETPNEANA